MHLASVFLTAVLLLQAAGNPISSPDNNGVSSENPAEDCSDCRLALRVFKTIFGTKIAKGYVAKAISFVCERLKIEDHPVCIGITSVYKDEVLYVLNELILEPGQFCAVILPSCGEARLPYYEWNVTLPDTPKPPVVVPSLPPDDGPKLRILHISDLHMDDWYTPGAEAECDEPICCRTMQNNTKKPAEKWGTVGKCDVPRYTVDKIFEHIAANEDFDIIYWTGDLPTHSVWNQTQGSQLASLDVLTAMFKKHFSDKLIYSTIGNHESVPCDSFPFNSQFIPKGYRNTWLYDRLAVQWPSYFNITDLGIHDAIVRRASYVVGLAPGLRLISINRNYCDGNNFWAYLNQTDPDGVLEWFAGELQKAEDAGDKVHVIGHEPFCGGKWKSNDENYQMIIRRYESTVAAQFFGHTHHEQMHVFFDFDDVTKPRPVSSMFLSGSITTFTDQNPSYKIYTVDARHNGTWGVLDYEKHYVALAESNAGDSNALVIKKEYAAAEAYGEKALFPANLYTIWVKMNIFSKYLDMYNRYYYSSYEPAIQACDEKCRKNFLCDIAVNLCNVVPHKLGFL